MTVSQALWLSHLILLLLRHVSAGRLKMSSGDSLWGLRQEKERSVSGIRLALQLCMRRVTEKRWSVSLFPRTSFSIAKSLEFIDAVVIKNFPLSVTSQANILLL